MVTYVVVVVLGAGIAAALGIAIIRAARTLSAVEAIALAWWILVAIIAFAGLASRNTVVAGVAGVLMVGLGGFVALNVAEIADRLGRRRVGWGAAWSRHSPAYWRLCGAGLAVVGAVWALGLGS